MSAEETPQNKKPWFNFFSDGMRFNYSKDRYIETRLSNIPKNLSKWPSFALTTAATAYQFLGNTTSAWPVNENSRFDNDYQHMCPGELSTYYFKAPNRTPYEINFANLPVNPSMTAAQFAFGSLADRLHELLQHLPQYCSANPITSMPSNYLPDQYHHVIPASAFITDWHGCYISVFFHPANMPSDPSFEACLHREMSNLGDRWTNEFLQFLARQESTQSTQLIIFAGYAIGAMVLVGAGAAGGYYGYHFFKERREKAILARSTESLNDVRLEKINYDQEKIPHEFLCPITSCIMTDPVKTTTGHVYERSAIEKQFALRNLNPMTGRALKDKTLTPELNLKKRIDAFVEQKEKEYAESQRSTSKLKRF